MIFKKIGEIIKDWFQNLVKCFIGLVYLLLTPQQPESTTPKTSPKSPKSGCRPVFSSSTLFFLGGRKFLSNEINFIAHNVELGIKSMLINLF